MTYDFLSLANKGLQTLKPYQPGKPIEELSRESGLTRIVKLASNENPIGPSPKAIAAIEACLQDSARYPDPNGFALKQALAKTYGVNLNQLTLGDGSDNLLDLIAQAFIKPGHTVLFPEDAFVTYQIVTQAHHGVPVKTPSPHFEVDLDCLLENITPETDLIFIATPNNPTGRWIEKTRWEAFLSQVPSHVLVVVDEAYYEFIADNPDYPDNIALQKRYPNLIVTRTFSKAYGLAAFRVGYAIAHPDITDILNRIRLPFNVTSLSLAAATAALEDTEHLKNTLACNQAGMAEMISFFESLEIEFIPSAGNFLTIDLKQSAMPIYEALLQKGVIVRPLLPYQMPNHLRVSIGTKEENAVFMEAFDAVWKTVQKGRS